MINCSAALLIEERPIAASRIPANREGHRRIDDSTDPIAWVGHLQHAPSRDKD